MIAKYKGKEIKDIKSIEEIAKANIMTYYNGFNEDVEYAIMKSHDSSMMIKFDNLLECKRFESKIRDQCTKFISRKYKPYGNSTILISNSLKKALAELKEGKDSYEILLWKIIMEVK